MIPTFLKSIQILYKALLHVNVHISLFASAQYFLTAATLRGHRILKKFSKILQLNQANAIHDVGNLSNICWLPGGLASARTSSAGIERN